MKLIPNQLELLANASLRAAHHRTLLGQRLHPVGRPSAVSPPHSSIPENLEACGEVQSKTCVACRVSEARLIILVWQGSKERAVMKARAVLFLFTVIFSDSCDVTVSRELLTVAAHL